MKISCEIICRMAKLIDREHEQEVFRTLRLENGMVIATDRQFMAVEQVESFEGYAHVIIDDALLTQCEMETQFSGMVEFIPNPHLKFTAAKTTMGWNAPGNVGYYPDQPTDFDKWRTVTQQCAQELQHSTGGMCWDTDGLIRLAQSSPSGLLIFEQNIDASSGRPTIIRDANSAFWCGFFIPRVNDGRQKLPAKMPEWLRPK